MTFKSDGADLVAALSAAPHANAGATSLGKGLESVDCVNRETPCKSAGAFFCRRVQCYLQEQTRLNLSSAAITTALQVNKMISDSRHAPAGRTPPAPTQRATRKPYWLFFACVLAALTAAAVLVAMTGQGHIAEGVGLTQPVTEKPDALPAPQ